MNTPPPRGPATIRPAMSDMQVRAVALQAAVAYAPPSELDETGDILTTFWVLEGFARSFERYIRTGVLVPPDQSRKADES